MYADADNYEKVLAKIYAGMSLSGLHGPSGNPDIAGIDEGFSQYIRVLWNFKNYLQIMLFADGTMLEFQKCVKWSGVQKTLCKSYVFKDIFSNPYCKCFYKRIF
ncbi:MAG: hypothetical protein CM15mP65_00580 [Crocinitomicaceae bacterium]|nr:MAG: hypothetical protein CM15mP65_00580 [Crocinitomicaceae bacterium]